MCYLDVIDTTKIEGKNSDSSNNIFDYFIAKLNELMMEMSSMNNLQTILAQIG